ncbi:vWA domain-containing protein [Phyllobacterium lublinensis]|uniref:vWA domain-containing protein n=1 Tax=Phyllobacterium lublinensis TaxID=2875708 RepID=UPI001CCCABF7|nr:VWA domain-containing protein [Phyllobacterium sp. 2063]MBZ9653421.1 VWA domain-containing protein [Phyllobacterium sp. 2063]
METFTSSPEIVRSESRLADNIVFFARTLRKAGLRVGPASVRDAIEAVLAGGIGSRDDFYWTLHSVLVTRHEDHATFDEAFRLYWRSRELIEKMLAMFSPVATASQRPQSRAAETRVAEALFKGSSRNEPGERPPDIDVDARFTFSDREVLRTKDFAQMSADELSQARRAMDELALPADRVETRRFRSNPKGARIDPRAMMRASLRTGGDLILPKFRSRRVEHPPLVVLADISGSMSQYTRIFLHFMHVMMAKRRRVHCFVFGTRLSNITRPLRHRDPDDAISRCVGLVKDWSGGTRIGETLREFNRQWSRRVLGQGAVVLLITDGLERDDTSSLEAEMERLSKSCRRLIWLNPLLRFEGFEPRARGVRAMLPYVDDFRAVHNLDALADLCQALSRPGEENDTSKRRSRPFHEGELHPY